MEANESLLSYPAPRRSDHTDDYHGATVSDPYRWMEDLDSPELKAWIEQQNRITARFLDGSVRDEIRPRVERLIRYEKRSSPIRRGDRYFFLLDDGARDHAVLCTAWLLEEEPQVVLDPNAFSDDGSVALFGHSLSNDGSLIAYGLSAGGSDWVEWRVRDVASGRDLDDVIRRVKFSIPAWTHDNAGFYYSAYDEHDPTGPNENHRLWYHLLGTKQLDDRLVFEVPDRPRSILEAFVTEDGQYLVIAVNRDSSGKCALFSAELAGDEAEIIPLVGEFDARYDVVGNDGSVFWIRTDLDAPRGRIIGVERNSPEPMNRRELVPEQAVPLTGVELVGRCFAVHYMKDVLTEIRLFTTEGEPVRDVRLPGNGFAALTGRAADREAFLSFVNPVTAETIFRYDLETGESTLWFRPSVGADAKGYECTQVFYESKDRTRVPMTICHRAGVELDGTNPTYLYGYGGFNVSVSPGFNAEAMAWMELGGIYAVANIRGGGEYGKDWHDAATRTRRQTAYDDFIAAAEWLVSSGYTSSKALAIAGASNGGTLVGACMTQRPDLFGACLPAVGVMDMLRFHLATIGWAWVDEYGSPQDPDEFAALYAYSPLHNLRSGTSYPATLITTADCDDRVLPWHSFKFAAALQQAHAGPMPVLLRVQSKSGHGAVSLTKKVGDITDRLSFLVRVLDMEPDLEDWRSSVGMTPIPGISAHMEVQELAGTAASSRDQLHNDE